MAILRQNLAVFRRFLTIIWISFIYPLFAALFFGPFLDSPSYGAKKWFFIDF
jgi:hypothetical protein